MSATTTLAFIDHARQDYADAVPIDFAAEFLVGDYGGIGEGVGELGEFKIAIHDLRDVGGGNRDDLTPQLCVFGDGAAAVFELTELCGGNLADLLADVRDADAFSRRLLALGLRDASDKPLVGDAVDEATGQGRR